MMIHLIKKIAHWLLPFTCVLCRDISERNQDLCHACLAELPILTNCCPRCANILVASNHLLCGQCIKSQAPFDRTHALFVYQPPIINLVLNLKFHHALENARLFGELLTEKICHEYQNKILPQAILPIPLHPTRLKQRGFNQALEIARPIAKTLKLPLLTEHCIRSKPTLAQATLRGTARQKNIRNAFAIVKPIPYQHVAVVDDVMTTGSTLFEFCRLLKNQHVQLIDVWVAARSASGNKPQSVI